MSYGQRVIAVMTLFFVATLGLQVYMVVVSTQWASDDMHVGHGHSKFPPQAPLESPSVRGGRP